MLFSNAQLLISAAQSDALFGRVLQSVRPPDHVDDVPVVEPNQHDDVLVDPEPILVDEDEDPEEEEFEEE
ncbi:hypothetical protein Tco_0587967 [Tanacetum coccineum]